MLFEPITIRRLELKNRIVMAPMTTRLAGPDGQVTTQLTAYYTARARRRRAHHPGARLAPPFGAHRSW